jgi:hypothetical protein
VLQLLYLLLPQLPQLTVFCSFDTVNTNLKKIQNRIYINNEPRLFIDFRKNVEYCLFFRMN